MAVMAKAPRPNHVKTRLVPPLTPAQAVSLSGCFLRDITENIRAASQLAPIAGYVAYAPAGFESLFEGRLAQDTSLLLADGGIDVPPGIQGFGRALFHAATALLQRGFGAVCLVNADSPSLPTACLREAAERLARPGDRMVLGVSDDGGYYLIGLKAVHAALFQEIAWSTDAVSAQTLAQAQRIGLAADMLPPWFDVDDAVSLQRLTAEMAASAIGSPTPYPAPVTRAWLAWNGFFSRPDAGTSGTAIPGGVTRKVDACLTNPSR